VKFKAGTRRRAIEYEKDWIKRWKQDGTFEKSVERRPQDNRYVFYDGPPFITGVPHHGTLLVSMIKDAVPRYQTMQGKRVERVWGWDTHGLPAERYTEKKLGIHSRQEVLDYGIENYINACRENMIQTGSEWQDTVDRIGRWVDFEGAYKTMDKDYMESIWWAFKTLYEKGKIYEGEKVLMYCTLDGTPLSKAEVTMDAGAYQDVTDPSVYVKFKLKDFKQLSEQNSKPTYLLAWTTTPWTLPANTAVAINQNEDYFAYEFENENLIVAGELAGKAFTDEKHQPIKFLNKWAIDAPELIGLSYEPLFVDRGENAHKVWHADYVETEAGTGIVHLAPTYGEEDFLLAKEKGFPAVHTIDQNGFFTEGDWKGANVWEVNKQIAKDLKERGVVWKIDYIRHSYPHCHRCGTKLMYRAHPSWFMDIDGQREKMLEKNESINWFPAHIKHGRFEKTVEQAPDWNISRDRFWATAMPVWKSESGKTKVIGSYAELKELSGVELDDYHRPWIDNVKFSIDGEEYIRIDKVMDSWFEAGSMSFAQFHYPFENKEKFEANFPGDFIVEYIAQTRAWFYYMHAVSIALFGENSFKNVIVTGTLAGNDGRKMSKSYGNYTDPNELMDKFSADSLRFLLLSSPLLNGEDFALQDKEVGDVARKLGMIWNMYDFFTMYAEVDGWEYDGNLSDPLDGLKNPLDIWIVSRLHQLVAEVEKNMDAYNIPDAMTPILPFLDDASNWYVRRSRRRFWKSEDDGDKSDAYRTLHYVLVRLAYVLAPFTPFLAEELYKNLTGDEESVHLKDWISAGNINEDTAGKMEFVREVVNEGLSERARNGVKVRQPLKHVLITSDSGLESLDDDYLEIIREELNVKEVMLGQGNTNRVTLDTTITPELKREGLMREIVRHVQNARKQAGLNVDDRIRLSLTTEDEELRAAIAEHTDTIAAETLANTLLQDSGKLSYETTVAVEGKELAVSLEKDGGV
jgi:isoleucyl-tRNA synthetase